MLKHIVYWRDKRFTFHCMQTAISVAKELTTRYESNATIESRRKDGAFESVLVIKWNPKNGEDRWDVTGHMF